MDGASSSRQKQQVVPPSTLFTLLSSHSFRYAPPFTLLSSHSSSATSSLPTHLFPLISSHSSLHTPLHTPLSHSSSLSSSHSYSHSLPTSLLSLNTLLISTHSSLPTPLITLHYSHSSLHIYLFAHLSSHSFLLTPIFTFLSAHPLFTLLFTRSFHCIPLCPLLFSNSSLHTSLHNIVTLHSTLPTPLFTPASQAENQSSVSLAREGGRLLAVLEVAICPCLCYTVLWWMVLKGAIIGCPTTGVSRCKSSNSTHVRRNSALTRSNRWTATRPLSKHLHTP